MYVYYSRYYYLCHRNIQRSLLYSLFLDAYLPLRFWRTNDGHFPFSLLLRWLVLFERRDLHAGSGESDDVPDVGTFGTDYGAYAAVRNVKEGSLLSVGGRNTLLSRQASLVGIWGGP